jgi:hypothetical protein
LDRRAETATRSTDYGTLDNAPTRIVADGRERHVSLDALLATMLRAAIAAGRARSRSSCWSGWRSPPDARAAGRCAGPAAPSDRAPRVLSRAASRCGEQTTDGTG